MNRNALPSLLLSVVVGVWPLPAPAACKFKDQAQQQACLKQEQAEAQRRQQLQQQAQQRQADLQRQQQLEAQRRAQEQARQAELQRQQQQQAQQRALEQQRQAELQRQQQRQQATSRCASGQVTIPRVGCALPVTLGNGQKVLVSPQGAFFDASGNPISNESVAAAKKGTPAIATTPTSQIPATKPAQTTAPAARVGINQPPSSIRSAPSGVHQSTVQSQAASKPQSSSAAASQTISQSPTARTVPTGAAVGSGTGRSLSAASTPATNVSATPQQASNSSTASAVGSVAERNRQSDTQPPKATAPSQSGPTPQTQNVITPCPSGQVTIPRAGCALPVTLGNGQKVFVSPQGVFFDASGNSISNESIASAKKGAPPVVAAPPVQPTPNLPSSTASIVSAGRAQQTAPQRRPVTVSSDATTSRPQATGGSTGAAGAPVGSGTSRTLSIASGAPSAGTGRGLQNASQTTATATPARAGGVPVGLTQDDMRWVRSLAPDLQNQLTSLPDETVDRIKANGRWGNVKFAFISAQQQKLERDAWLAREQEKIWSDAVNKFKTTIEYGSLALGVGELTLGARALVQARRVYVASKEAALAPRTSAIGASEAAVEITVRTAGRNTVSSLSKGQAMHKTYRANEANGVTKFKEFILPSGRKIDFLDVENGVVYELKPDNLRSIKEGQAQLKRYLAELRTMKQFQGISWKAVLETY